MEFIPGLIASADSSGRPLYICFSFLDMVKAKSRGKPQTQLKILNLCDLGQRKKCGSA